MLQASHEQVRTTSPVSLEALPKKAGRATAVRWMAPKRKTKRQTLGELNKDIINNYDEWMAFAVKNTVRLTGKPTL